MASDYTGLANYIASMNEAAKSIPRQIARDPVVQGLANAVVTNPVVQSVGNYIYTKSPMEVANDVASVGAIAASMSNPLTAPAGLAGLTRVVGPRTANGLVQAGKEYLENHLANQVASRALDAGLLTEDSYNIAKAVRRGR